MKNKILKIAMIAVMTLFIKGIAIAQTPERIAKQFLAALYSGDVTAMQNLLTEESAKTAARHTWSGDTNKLEMLKNSESQTFDSDLSSSIKVVRFYYPRKDTSKKNKGSFASVELIQQRGVWKVSEWGY